MVWLCPPAEAVRVPEAPPGPSAVNSPSSVMEPMLPYTVQEMAPTSRMAARDQ